MQRALHFQSIIFQIPAEAKTSQTHAFAHVANVSSSRIAKCQSRKINALHKNIISTMFKTLTCKTSGNKVQFGSCCCRANTSCEANQIPNDFQKHHSHCQRPKTHSRKMLFSMKTSSTVNDIIPDMMASRRLPENTKTNDFYLVHWRDLVNTNLNTSASYLEQIPE